MGFSPLPTWQNPPKLLKIESDEIHIWLVPLEVDPSIINHLRQIISDDERIRADRFRFERHRNRFIVARGLLRVTLALYLKKDPIELIFNYNDYGKPVLAEQSGGDRLKFNVSHSHVLALFGITLDHEIGIDIERIRPDFAELKIAQRFFSAREVEVLMSLPEAIQKSAFFNCWTRKEAFIKAKGKGLSIPLSQFDASLAPDEPAELLTVKNEPQEAARWLLYNLDPGEDYKAALAVEKNNWQLRYWKWTEQSIYQALLNSEFLK